jgi:hypothetical protein
LFDVIFENGEQICLGFRGLRHRQSLQKSLNPSGAIFSVAQQMDAQNLAEELVGNPDARLPPAAPPPARRAA